MAELMVFITTSIWIPMNYSRATQVVDVYSSTEPASSAPRGRNAETGRKSTEAFDTGSNAMDETAAGLKLGISSSRWSLRTMACCPGSTPTKA
jgi:hypothetical protein